MRDYNTCPYWLIFSHISSGTFERYKRNQNKKNKKTDKFIKCT